jgi:hypothetical protein
LLFYLFLLSGLGFKKFNLFESNQKEKTEPLYRPLGIQSQTSLSTTIKQKLIKQLAFLRSVHLLLRAISRFDIPLDLSAGISVDFFSYQL